MTAMLFELTEMVSQHSEERNLLLRPIRLCLSLSEWTGRENSATLQHDLFSRNKRLKQRNKDKGLFISSFILCGFVSRAFSRRRRSGTSYSIMNGCTVLTHWLVIYSVDSSLQPLKNWGLAATRLVFRWRRGCPTDRGNRETADMLVDTDILWECELIFHAIFFFTKSVWSLIECLKAV